MDMVIWRYREDGTLDPTFGTGGFVVHHSAAGGGGWDQAHGVVLDSRGRIVVTGESDAGGGNVDMVVWRYR
jgi:hypothetical protein